jgi:hypothetical protein
MINRTATPGKYQESAMSGPPPPSICFVRCRRFARSSAAQAQTGRSGQSILVPYAAAGCRQYGAATAQRLSDALPTFVVENRVGGNSAIAARQSLRHGRHTLLWRSSRPRSFPP